MNTLLYKEYPVEAVPFKSGERSNNGAREEEKELLDFWKHTSKFGLGSTIRRVFQILIDIEMLTSVASFPRPAGGQRRGAGAAGGAGRGRVLSRGAIDHLSPGMCLLERTRVIFNFRQSFLGRAGGARAAGGPLSSTRRRFRLNYDIAGLSGSIVGMDVDTAVVFALV
ncbi:hypothetical protein EVAR_35781_1 [Eumeta japonica]|uniref:Uncharacterized protein n=1 Tax=Eumeta variegata TaxID=151549 RepID=A0A4C1WPZ0_EUMVA|nr:hypothetical protein EVAR_35781_1 [Eumeta japonica]